MAAVVLHGGAPSERELAGELAELRKVFGDEPIELAYGIPAQGELPLVVETG